MYVCVYMCERGGGVYIRIICILVCVWGVVKGSLTRVLTLPLD